MTSSEVEVSDSFSVTTIPDAPKNRMLPLLITEVHVRGPGVADWMVRAWEVNSPTPSRAQVSWHWSVCSAFAIRKTHWLPNLPTRSLPFSR